MTSKNQNKSEAMDFEVLNFDNPKQLHVVASEEESPVKKNYDALNEKCDIVLTKIKKRKENSNGRKKK